MPQVKPPSMRVKLRLSLAVEEPSVPGRGAASYLGLDEPMKTFASGRAKRLKWLLG